MRRGFTLIEVLLALLVVTTGVIAATGLLGSALDADAKARADLHAVSFADLVLNHLQAAERWEAIPTMGAWSLPDYRGKPTVVLLGGVHTFTSFSAGKVGSGRARFTVSYQLEIQQQGRVKQVSLKVWPGATPRGEARLFQTSIYDWNDENSTRN